MCVTLIAIKHLIYVLFHIAPIHISPYLYIICTYITADCSFIKTFFYSFYNPHRSKHVVFFYKTSNDCYQFFHSTFMSLSIYFIFRNQN